MNLKDLVLAKSAKVTNDVIYDKQLGVSLNLTYVSPTDLSALMGRCVKMVTNRKTHQMEQELDGEKVADEILKNYVNGWKGVTYEFLSSIFPMDLSKVANPKEEVPFTLENLKTVTENVPGMNMWIFEAAKDGSNFKSINKESELKN